MDCPICGYKMEAHHCFCANCGHYVLPLKNNEQTPSPQDIRPETSNDENFTQNTTEDCLEMSPPEGQEPASAEGKSRGKKHIPYRRMKGICIGCSAFAVFMLVLSLVILISNASQRVNLVKAEKTIASAQGQIETLEKEKRAMADELSTIKDENKELKSENNTLIDKVSDLETTINQTTYDEEAAARDLEEAKSALLTAEEDIMALEQDIKFVSETLTQTEETLAETTETLNKTTERLATAEMKLESATSENIALQDEITAYESETEFYDSYVVFVMLNSGNRLYHKYDCHEFTGRNFVAYSTKLAEANGYSPCPTCCG